MSFTRKELAALTGVPFAKIATWQRRGQLPTAHDPNDAPHDDTMEAAGRSWTRYTAADVLAVAALDMLTASLGQSGGEPPEFAVRIATGLRSDLVDVAQTVRRSHDQPDRHGGYLVFRVGGRHFCGTMRELDVLSERYRAAGDPIIRSILINADDLVRQLFRRAGLAGITFDPQAT